MSVVTLLELQCDLCWETATYSVFGHEGQRKLRRHAKEEGWRRMRSEAHDALIDVCPKHEGEDSQ